MISAVVVFHSDLARLKMALESLTGQADEILVIDVSPSSGTRGLPPQPQVTYLPKPENLGYGWACNLGIKESTHDLVLISNPDVVYEDEALSQLAESARLGHLCGPVQLRGQSQDHGSDAAESLQLGISRAASLSRWLGIGRRGFDNRRRALLLDHDSAITVTPTDITLSGAALMATRETWERLGGFDERFFLYQEDADLCVRAHEMGIPVSLVRGARMAHWSGTARRDFDIAVVRWAMRSERQAWQAHDLPVAWLKLIQLLGVSARVMASLAHRRFRETAGWARTLGTVVAS